MVLVLVSFSWFVEGFKSCTGFNSLGLGFRVLGFRVLGTFRFEFSGFGV